MQAVLIAGFSLQQAFRPRLPRAGAAGFFALRMAGGLIYLERLRRGRFHLRRAGSLAKCRELQARLGLTRVIRFCECHWLDAPAVIGWFRPVVLLPVRALTGLTEDQIEPSSRTNSHTSAASTLSSIFPGHRGIASLFPSGGLVAEQARARRARKLLRRRRRRRLRQSSRLRARPHHMEEWRATPALSIAANGSPLAARISRILACATLRKSRTAGLGAGFVLLRRSDHRRFFALGRFAPRSRSSRATALFSPFQEITELEAQAQTPAPASKPSPKTTPKPAPEPQVKPDAQATPQSFLH